MEKETVFEFIDSINQHDVDRIYELMSDDFKFIDAYGHEENGKDHMKESWIGYFKWFPDYTIEAVDMLTGEDAIFGVFGFARGTYQNKETDNNENYWRLPASWKVKVYNHKIQLWQVYCNSKIPFDIIERNNC